MGQLIDVAATNLGDVALFDLDRSLTGQDGVAFVSVPEEPDGPPAMLARRLFDDQGVESVYVQSNTVSVKRSEPWSAETLGAASEAISKLFVVYSSDPLEARAERLRAESYNATITLIREHNPELWILRVRCDEPLQQYTAGQYTTLGLGFWEPRTDDVDEDFDHTHEQWDKLARRSYSVSSSIIDANNELFPEQPEDVEFYIVKVPPHHEEIPALTPRLFTRQVGDRIYMSPKFTGRYTLEGVSPDDNVVFLSTGTGEAPQNAMTTALLRRGHRGRILNVVTARYKNDLGYLDEQTRVQGLFPNYKYVGLTTREPENENNKVYIQDMLSSGALEESLGAPLDPANTRFFLCGNPAMIGIPSWDDNDQPEFPEPVGVCQLLHERGFTIDHRSKRGNVHYEKYWADG